jgi:hypothetical protein
MTDTATSPTIAHLEGRVAGFTDRIEWHQRNRVIAENQVAEANKGIAECEAERADTLAAIETLRNAG